MPLAIDVMRASSPGGPTVTVALRGRLDSDTAPQFEAALRPVLESYVRHVIFDLAELQFISSAGIRVFILARKQLKTPDCTLSMKNLQPQIAKVFEIIRSVPGFQIFKDQAELDEYLAAMQEKYTKPGQ